MQQQPAASCNMRFQKLGNSWTIKYPNMSIVAVTFDYNAIFCLDDEFGSLIGQALAKRLQHNLAAVLNESLLYSYKWPACS